MRRLVWTVPVLAILVLSGGNAWSQPGGPGGFGGFKGPMNERVELVEKFDKNGNGWLNKSERKEARDYIKKQKSSGKGGPGGFGPPGGFGGFNPSNFVAKALLEALDTDKDGVISKAELVAGVKKFFAECDKDKNGTLDEAQIADGLNRILPKPKFGGFGPPGGGPGGPPPGPPKDGDFEVSFQPGPPGGGPGGPKFPPGGGFGLGKSMANAIFKRADTSKEGKVTLKQLLAAAESLFQETDKEKSGKLGEKELAAAIGLLSPAPGGFGPPGGFGKGKEPGKPGPKVAPADVKSYPKDSLYEPNILRTIFLEFEDQDWEEEMADFYHTDVEVPAAVTVDGKKYPNVGVRFRGNSSYFMVPKGSKHSLHLSFDLVNEKQNLYGYRAMTLLNSADDPSFMSSVLFSHIARQHIPCPKANFVKVVINGESWGVFVNQQPFNKEFIAENYKTTKGARWKVPGHPGANGGLSYLGDKIDDYKRHYQIKSKDDNKSWKALIALCKTLNKTPADKLEKAVESMLDIDNVLWFLALDIAVINDDGYWTRASDYSIFQDPKGKFHVIPHDFNECFQPAKGFGKGPKGPPGGGGFGPGGPGGGGGMGKGGVELDPLIGMDDGNKPLRSKLLAVPAFKKKYLENLRTIAEGGLNWKNLGPVVAKYRALIEKEIELDSRKLYSLAEFKKAVSDVADAGGPGPGGPGGFFGKGPGLSLKSFADQRCQYLLNHPDIKNLGKGEGK